MRLNTFINCPCIIISIVEMKQCYYELLGVDKKATTTEIKQSYRKMALKYHPDKNPSEEAKSIFVTLNEAYTVLSDPNERTWYDNNREKILFNKEDMSKEDLEVHTFGFNIWNYFTVSCFSGFEDDEGGFYQVYRDIFEKLKEEETKAFAMRDDLEEQMRKYEGFGVSTTILDKVVKFYEDWQNFTTYKTFVWADDWDTRDAANRYVKRAMEKENKKERQKEKKTYIKTIKDLVSFLKKRDPRYRQLVMKQKEEEEERERQKKIKEEEKKKEKEEMKKVKAELEMKRFQQIQEYYKKQNQANGVSVQEEQQYEEVTCEFYCAVCEKGFKSDNQLKNHEKSKMHKQNVKNLQKEVMMKDEIILEVKKSVEKELETPVEPVSKKSKKNKKKNKNINEADDIIVKDQEEPAEEPVKQVKNMQKKNKPVSSQSEEEPPKKKQAPKKNGKNKPKVEESESDEPTEVPAKTNNKKQSASDKKQSKKPKKPASDEESSEDDANAFMEAMLGKKQGKEVDQEEETKGKKKKGKAAVVAIESSSEEQEDNQGLKKGKAKQRREKKAAKQEQDSGLKCKVCSDVFPSKTKLFDHIKKTGHAKAV